MNFRPGLLWLHRWIGIFAGLVILVLAATGAILIFERPIDRWLNPEFYPSKPRPAVPQTIEATLAVLHRQRPAARVSWLRFPRDEWDALVGFHGTRAVHLDQGRGEVLGSRPSNEGLIRTVTRLHVNLFAGKIGGTMVVIATGLTLGLAASGLWLWWPSRIFAVRRDGNFRRFTLDLHSAAGLYSSLFLLIFAGTGLTLHFLRVEPLPVPESNPPPSPAQRIAADAALANAQRALPGTRAVACELPALPQSPFRIHLAFPEDRSAVGRSIVFLDQYTGETLSVISSREGSLRRRYFNLQLPIHTGSVFGWPSQVVAMLTCLALTLQVISGYVLWWKRGSATRS